MTRKLYHFACQFLKWICMWGLRPLMARRHGAFRNFLGDLGQAWERKVSTLFGISSW
jgi:hypothetical protein